MLGVIFEEEPVLICKGCNQEKKLIKAHIIPEAFFVGLRDNGKSPLLVTDTGSYPERAPIGVYDKTILCHDCEQRFQDIDSYGQDLLLKQQHKNIEKNGSIVGYEIQGVDYDLVKLCFISILWRASISTQMFYSHVTLGRFEDIAKKHIWSRASGAPEEFSFLLAKFTDEKFGTAMLDPHRERWEGINYYRFYLFGYILHIKVDRRQTPQCFRPFVLKSDGNIFVIGRDVSQSKELKVMYDVVNSRK